MKKIITFVLLYTLSLQLAYGEVRGGWGEKEYISNITPTIEAQIFNNNSSVTYTNPALSKITQGLYDSLNQLEYELSSEIESLVADEVKRLSRGNFLGAFSYRLRSFSFNMTPINIRLVGLTNGKVRAELEFNISIYARIRDTGILSAIPSNVSINFDSEKILFSGIYDSNSGLISDLNLDVLEGNTSSSSNNILYELAKIFKSINIQNILAAQVSSFKDNLNESFNGQYSIIWGLNDFIPSGVLIVEGKDIGSEIKSSLNNLMLDQFVNLRLGRIIKYYSGGEVYRGANLFINLSNQASLHVFDNISTYTVWPGCEPLTGICHQLP